MDLAELTRIEAQLQPFYDRMRRKWCDQGMNWRVPLTPEEEVLWNLWYFYSAALICDADVFGYLWHIIEYKEAFEAIGASGCLAALEKLLPFYEEQEQLDYNEKGKYWHQTRADRAEAEALAEDPEQFLRLLLTFARENADRIGSGLSD